MSCCNKQLDRNRVFVNRMLIDKFSTKSTDIPITNSQYTQAEAVLNHYFGQLSSFIGVEIGTGDGAWTRHMLERFPNLQHILGIDSWKFRLGYNFEANKPQKWHDQNRHMATSTLAEYDNRVKLIQDISSVALRDLRFEQKQFDFVWVDGGHDFKVVMADITDGAQIVRKGGIIAGTNFGLVLDVTASATRFANLNKYKLYHGGDYVWWIQL